MQRGEEQKEEKRDGLSQQRLVDASHWAIGATNHDIKKSVFSLFI